MSLFKRRLKQLGITLLTYLICIVGICLLLWIVSLVPHTLSVVVAYTIIGLFVLGMVWAFIYWLFIEPFKKEK